MQENPHNRRKFPRIALETTLAIVFEGVSARRQRLVDNLGAGGLFLRTDHPKPVGTKIRFEFLVRDGGEKIAGSGIVQWVNNDPDGPPGMGIKFVELNDEGRKEILQVLKERKAAPD
ncbi:MAG: TIGR02266 family protein [Pseudomonadota bacterium]